MILPDVLDERHHPLRRRARPGRRRPRRRARSARDLRVAPRRPRRGGALPDRRPTPRAPHAGRRRHRRHRGRRRRPGRPSIVRRGRERHPGRARAPGARHQRADARSSTSRDSTGRPSTAILDRTRACASKTVAADDSDRQASAAILSLVLYLILLLLMIQVASGVAIEKANRISEVLLAVVKPTRAVLREGRRRRPGRAGRTRRRRDPGRGEGGRQAATSPPGLGPAIARRPPVDGARTRALPHHRRRARRAGRAPGGGGLGAHAAQPPAHRHLRAGAELRRRQLRRGAGDLPVHVADRDAGAASRSVPRRRARSWPRSSSGSRPSCSSCRLGAAVYRRGIVHTGRRMQLGEVLRTT